MILQEIDNLTAQIETLKQRIAAGRPKKLEEWKTKVWNDLLFYTDECSRVVHPR